MSNSIAQITDPDKRFYEHAPGVYYPSMTTVLGLGSPTPSHIHTWNKANGNNADLLLTKAGKEGSWVHNALEDWLGGTELRYEDFASKPLHIWEMICKGVFFLSNYVVDVHYVEVKMTSSRWRLGGMTDLVATLTDGRKWIIDYKTSNYNDLHKFPAQTYGYKELLKDTFGFEVEARGVLHLKAKTRGTRKDKMQGKGWQLIEHIDDKLDAQKLLMARKSFDLYHPDAKPANVRYPTVLTPGEVYNEKDYELSMDEV